MVVTVLNCCVQVILMDLSLVEFLVLSKIRIDLFIGDRTNVL